MGAPYELPQVTAVLKNLMQVVSVEKTTDRAIARPATAFLKNLALLNEYELQQQQSAYTQQGEMFEMSQ